MEAGSSVLPRHPGSTWGGSVPFLKGPSVRIQEVHGRLLSYTQAKSLATGPLDAHVSLTNDPWDSCIFSASTKVKLQVTRRKQSNPGCYLWRFMSPQRVVPTDANSSTIIEVVIITFIYNMEGKQGEYIYFLIS